MGRPGAFLLAPLMLAVLPAACAAGTDRHDLVLLAGHVDVFVNMTSAALAALGWESGLTVNFNNDLDQALTFYKSGTCLLTFSAVNDPTDTQQILGGAAVAPVPLCGHDVHAGVAQELQGFMSDPGFGHVVEFMNQARCTETVAAGVSLGGALAGLWAACASRGEPGFGARTGYRLVTFGSPPVTLAPLSNAAHPSGVFEGTRYAITEPDGGAGRLTGLRGDFRAFALDSMQLLRDFAAAKGMAAEAALVSGLLAALNSTGAAEFESVWVSTTRNVAPLWLLVLGESMQSPPTPPAQLVMGWIMSRVPTGLLSFEYDPVPVCMYPFGFQHPLVNFQPLPNPLFAGRPSMDMVPAAGPEVAGLPRGEFVQAGFGMLLGEGWFPNHNSCCYADMGLEECKQQYHPGPGGEPWRICANQMLAYLPPAENPARNYTCGEAKSMYRTHECCGRPSSPFTFPAPSTPTAHNFTCGDVKRMFKASNCCGNPAAPFRLP